MILHRQLEVGKGDSDTSSDNVEDNENNAEDSIEGVVLVSPHAAVDVEELNVDGTEGEESCHHHLEGKSTVPILQEKMLLL